MNTYMSAMERPDSFAGPCLKHCYQCSALTVALAYCSLAYVIASVAYLLKTRNGPSPLHESFTDEQLELLARSTAARTRIFFDGLAFAAFGLYVFRPLRV